MPFYKVEGPDGTMYRVEGPENATDEALIDALRSHLHGTRWDTWNPMAGSEDSYKPGQDYEPEQEYSSEPTSFLRDVADVGTGFVSGIPKAAGAITSLGSQIRGLHYVADPLSAWLQDVGEGIDDALLSERQKEINQELSDRLQAAAAELGPDAEISDYIDSMIAQGGEAGAFIADHPGQVFNLVAASLPYVFGGGVVTKGVNAGLKAGAKLAGLKPISKMGSITGAAVGEGAITAGEVTRNIIEQTDSVGDYSTDRLAAVPAGITTAAISRLSGGAARKAGLADIDTVVTSKIAGTPKDLIKQSTKQGLTRKVVSGAFREGVLEEAPQSFQEKVWENVGTGEHPLTDTGGETVLGTFTGAGQGAGVNTYTGLKESREAKKQRIAEREAEIELEKEERAREQEEKAAAQASQDEAFIADANSIGVGMTYKEFGEKWANILGVSEDEVFADPRFGVIQQEKEAEQEAKNKELRLKHMGTFPNEKEWNKETAKANNAQQLEDLKNPESELGAAFNAWRLETNNYNTDGTAEKEFLKQWTKDNPVSKESQKQAYLAALDEHAQQQEEIDPHGYQSRAAQEGLTEAEWLAQNIETLSTLDPSTIKHYDPEAVAADIAKKQERLDALLAAEESVNTTTDVAEEKLTKAQQEAKNQAIELFGEKFEEERPGLSQTLHDGFTKAKWNKAIEKEKAADLVADNEGKAEAKTQQTPPTIKQPTGVPETNEEGEVQETSQTRESYNDAISDILNSTDIDWSKRLGQTKGRTSEARPRYVRWLRDEMANSGDEKLFGTNDQMSTTRAAEALGVNKSTISRLRKEVEAIVTDELNKRGVAHTEGSRIASKEEPTTAITTSEQGATAPSNTVADEDTLEQYDDSTDNNLDGFTIRSEGKGDSSQGQMSLYRDDQEHVEQEIAKTDARNKEFMRWFAEKYDAIVDKGATQEEINDFVQMSNEAYNTTPDLKQQIKSHVLVKSRIDKMLNDPAVLEKVSALWNEYKTNGVASFDQLPNMVKYDWALAVEEAVESRGYAKLQEDQRQLEQIHDIAEVTNEKADSKRKLESQKQPGKDSRRNESLEKDRSTPKPDRGTSTSKVRDDAKVVLNEQQREAVAYAEEKIGRDWQTRKRLPVLLKKSNLKEFYKFVDRVASHNIKADDLKKRNAKVGAQIEAAKEKPAEAKTEAEKIVRKPTKGAAQKYARQRLGKYWRKEYPSLAAKLKGKDWDASGFQKEVDSIAETGVADAVIVEDDYRRDSIDTSEPKGTATKADIENVVAEILAKKKSDLTERDMRRIHVFQNDKELSDAIVNDNLLGDRISAKEKANLKKGKTYGSQAVAFVTFKDGQRHAFFILDKMIKGRSVTSTFMHEVGVHMAMESLLKPHKFRALSRTVHRWAGLNDGSLEAELGRLVEDRLELINEMREKEGLARLSKDGENSERVAYAVQFAIENGIQPTALNAKRGQVAGEGTVQEFINNIYKHFKAAMSKFLGVQVKELTAVDLVDMAYGFARLEMAKNYHVSTAPKIAKVNLSHAGSGLDGAVNGFGFNIVERFSSAGVYARELASRKEKKVRLNQVVDSLKADYPKVAAKLESLRTNGAYLLRGPDVKKWKPLQWNMFSMSYLPGGLEGHTVEITHDKSGDSYDMLLELRLEDGGRMFTSTELSIIGAAITHEKGSDGQVFTHFVDTTVSDEELMKFDEPIGEQEHVMKFVNSMPKELQDLIIAENDSGATQVEELSGRDLYEMLVLIEGGHANSNPEGFQLITQLEKQYKLTADDLRVSRKVPGEMKHTAKIAAILDKAGIKGTLILDHTPTKDSPSMFSDPSDRHAAGHSAKAKLLEGTYNKVIFNGDNVITAGVVSMESKNVSNFDLNNYTRFSMNPSNENKDEDRMVRKTIRKVLGENAEAQWVTIGSLFRDAAAELTLPQDLIEKYRFELPSLDTWSRAYDEFIEAGNRIKQMVDDIAVRANRLSEKRRKAVAAFIEKATVEQKWFFDPETRKVKVDETLAEDFENMFNEEEQQLIKDVFLHGEKMLARKRKIVEALGIDSEFVGISQMKGPYAPLKRFGDHVVVLKSQHLLDLELSLETATSDSEAKEIQKQIEAAKLHDYHYVVSFFGTEGAAMLFRRKNKDKYAEATLTKKAKVVGKGYSSDNKVLEKVYGALSVSSLDKDTQAQVKEILQDLYHASLEEANARHAQVKRHGYAGYSSDMFRAFVEHGRAEASLIANMEWGKELNVLLAETHKEAKASKDKEHMDAFNDIVDHYNLLLQGKDMPITQAILAANSFWLLTSSPGYHMQNGTQTFAVAHPVLAGDFGDWNGTRKEIMEGYRVARDVVTLHIRGGLQTEINVDLAPPHLRELLKHLQLRKGLDVGIEEDLSETTSSETGFKTVDTATKKASNLSHRAFQVARLVEAYNRVSTAIAAYEMAKKHPEVMKRRNTNPVDYAIKRVKDTQGDFSAFGAPKLFKRASKNPIGKVALQFKKFSVVMAWNYLRAFNEAFKGATPVEKKVGRRTLYYMLSHTAVLSGLRGLPLPIATIVLLATGEDEDPEDTDGAFEREVRETLGDNAFSTMLLRGVPAALGVDASMKLSHAGIFDPAPFADYSLRSDELPDTVMNVMLGPTGANALNTFRAFDYARDGNYWRATEYLMPKGIRHIMEAERFKTEGYSKKSGDIMVTPKNFSQTQLFLSSLGIPASDIVRMKWTRGEQYEIEKHFTERQAEVTRQYVDARTNGDTKAEEEAVREFLLIQDAKDRARPFFGKAHNAIPRTPRSKLYSAYFKKHRREQEGRRRLQKRED